MDVSENSGFSLQIIHFNRVFHSKPSILGYPGYPYFWKHPYAFDSNFGILAVPKGSVDKKKSKQIWIKPTPTVAHHEPQNLWAYLGYHSKTWMSRAFWRTYPLLFTTMLGKDLPLFHWISNKGTLSRFSTTCNLKFRRHDLIPIIDHFHRVRSRAAPTATTEYRLKHSILNLKFVGVLCHFSASSRPVCNAWLNSSAEV